MKVGIDTFGCGHGKTGLGSYLDSLTRCLQNTENDCFELFGAEIDRYTYGADNGLKFNSVHLPDSRRIKRIWHYAGANLFAAKHKFDVVMYAAGARYLPIMFGVPGVAIVNDLVSEVYADEVLSSRLLRLLVGLKNASRVIVPSQFIRKDLIKLGVSENNITVIHNGIDHSVFYPQEILFPNLVDIKPFAIKQPYFLYASRMSGPSKKHIELIRAFELFKQKTHLEHRLVLAGSIGESAEEVKQAVLESPYCQDIFITGFYPRESFPLLYALSEGCLFPSVNEGVGLPVLEAMATGVPVACSNSGALPEIAGSNAIYFDSDNIEQMSAAIEQLALDSALRKKLIEGGIDWTKRFTWEKTAEKTVQVLKEAAEK